MNLVQHTKQESQYGIQNIPTRVPATTMGIQSRTATTIIREPNSINGNQNGKKGKQNLEIKLINIQLYKHCRS